MTTQLQWEQVLEKLQESIELTAFESWIKPIQFRSFTNEVLYLSVPSQFIKNWVLMYYKDSLFNSLAALAISARDIEITVSTFVKEEIIQDSCVPIPNYQKQETIGFILEPSYRFENFIVGKSNEFAYNAARRVAEDTKIHFNPLFIHGGVGLGKTHLMQSIAWHVKDSNQKRNFLYLSAEKFMNLFIQSLRNKDIITFKEMFRSTDVLMIDDFQFIGGKEQTQEEFFHTFNALIEQGKQIILSADKTPLDLDKIEERIISRLQAGLAVDIHATTYELRVGILQSKIEQLNVKIPKDVVNFLAHSVTSNIRELEGALKRIVAFHQLVGQKIDLDMATKSIEDILRHKNKVVSIDFIQKKVAEHFSIKLSDMSAPKRDKNIVKPRQIAMFLAKELTPASLPEIGKKFGGRDHTTVLYAVKKIQDEVLRDQSLESEIKLLSRIIQKG